MVEKYLQDSTCVSSVETFGSQHCQTKQTSNVIIYVPDITHSKNCISLTKEVNENNKILIK